MYFIFKLNKSYICKNTFEKFIHTLLCYKYE
nr:MAG TPA: hypothetical protein [Caudoviricetes sp.]